MVHTLVGGFAGVVWLVLPGMTINAAVPVPAARTTQDTATAPETASAAQAEDEKSTVDLVLPLVAVGAAIVLAGYGYVRRTRRAKNRTTPARISALPSPAEPPIPELDERARALLSEADDWVRTSREELGFATARFGEPAAEPFTKVLRDAEAELSAAFRMRRQYDDGVPEDGTARRHALAGIVGRCQEAGRVLDAETPAFDRLRGLERGVGEALEIAETRFRELAGRTGATETTLTELGDRYGPAAVDRVTGYVEHAKDRLVFTTSRLNESRQTAYRGESRRAIRHLREAEGAVTQAAEFIDAVDDLATDLARAEDLLPTALTGAEAELAEARGAARAAGDQKRPPRRGAGTRKQSPVGEIGDAWAHPPEEIAGARQQAPAVSARARQQSTGQAAGAPGNPATVTRRSADIEDTASLADTGPRAVAQVTPALTPSELHARLSRADLVLAAVREEVTGGPYDPVDALRRVVGAVLPVTGGSAGVLAVAASFVAGSSVRGADGFVSTHRGVVGAGARTRLAEAVRLLGAEPADPLAADALAREARALAERDVRAHGNPVAGAAEHASGLAGAVLGEVLLDGGTPPSFGGPRTRARHDDADLP
ncbi:hypothetical protein [Streptomyces sp. NPDC088794]|uniref:hypothetical protein n=1 Tax=Streptomyces sp. NPDC088794 TaxID=3365902 RepID=UPI0038284299